MVRREKQLCPRELDLRITNTISWKEEHILVMREMKPPRWSALTRQEDLFRWDDLSLRRATGRWGIRRISQPRDIPRSSSRYISSSVSACGITSLPSYCHHPAVLDCNARYSHLPPWCLVFCTRAIECLPFCSSLRKAYSWLRHISVLKILFTPKSVYQEIDSRRGTYL